jgi:hypothetical protein
MLTDTTIKQVRSSKKTQKLFDGYRTGLHLLVHPGGRKTFAIKYPHPITKKERTFTIGPYPHITLKEARAETEKARALLPAVQQLQLAGAHEVIDSVADLPQAIARIEQRMANGETP